MFTAAKISHLGLLPQGQPERYDRVLNMVAQVKKEMFGSCTNIGECETVCPKEIKIEVIARMNRDYLVGSWTHRGDTFRVQDEPRLKTLYCCGLFERRYLWFRKV